MPSVKPYWRCATRIENRGCEPPASAVVETLLDGLQASGVEATWHSAVDYIGSPLFPSKVFPDCHPKADLKVFHDLIERVHAMGKPILSWMPLNLGGGVLKSHPEWRMQFYDLPEQELTVNQVRNYVCPNTPFGELLPRFAAEVVETLGFDGVWFDGSTFSNHSTGPWFAPGCKCRWCRERFQEDTGLELPDRIDYDDPAFKRWVKWRYGVLMGLWSACSEAVKRVRPDSFACFNNYRRRSQGLFAWNTGIPLRKLGLDAMMGGELDGFPHQADFQIKMHRAYGMSLGSETWWPLLDHWRGWVPDHDPLPAVQAHLSAVSAGGACCMGVGVDLKIFAPVLQHIQKTIGPRIEFNDGTPIPYAAIWCSQNWQDFGCREQPDEAWDSWHGANELLKHIHAQTSVVFDDHIEDDDMAEYPIVLAGDTTCISDSQAKAIEHYVRCGGTLIACRNIGTKDEWGDLRDKPVLDELLGISSRRPAAAGTTLELNDAFAEAAGTRYVTYGWGNVVCTPVDDVEMLADIVERTGGHWDNTGESEVPFTRSPGLWVRRVGNGSVVYTGVDLFGDYLIGPTPQMRKLVRQLLFTLKRPKVTMDGPISVVINSSTKSDGTLMIHLHNCPGTAYRYPAPKGGNCLYTPGEVVPVHDLVLRLNGIKAESAVSGLTGESFGIEDDRSVIRVPRLDLHDVLLVR